MVPLFGGCIVVPLFGGVVTGRSGDVTDTAWDRSAALALPQMSVTPPADIDSVAGAAPRSKSTYATLSPCPCRTPSTSMATPSASYTRTRSASTFHTASLKDTLRTPVPVSYPADDIWGGAVSLYDMATFSSSAL